MNTKKILYHRQRFPIWKIMWQNTQGFPLSVVLLLSLQMFSQPEGYAQSKTLLNLDRKGVMIEGYDPVAFYTQHRPVEGSPAFQTKYNGAIYYFESAANKNIFEKNPAQYEPQFGGFCAYAVSLGKTASIEVETFSIVHGRLLFQYDEDIFEQWKKDVEGNLKKADKNWPQLVAEEGQ